MSFNRDMWDESRQRSILFSHVDCKDEIFDGKVCSTTMGKVLLDLTDNPGERYVWFMKRDLKLIKS